jgi:uncharacterized membrane protein HdeD (DUF308 family)
MVTSNLLLRDMETLRRNWGWFLVLGIVLILLGLFAIEQAFLATITAMLVFGWLLAAAGILQFIHAFWVREWGGFLLQLLAGLLEIVVGIAIAHHPLATGAALTLIMAIFFTVGGVFRMIAAIAATFEGRGWLFVSGLINLVLGIMIWTSWPASGLWVIGLFIGIDLLFQGFWLVMLSISARSLPKGTTGAVV